MDGSITFFLELAAIICALLSAFFSCAAALKMQKILPISENSINQLIYVVASLEKHHSSLAKSLYNKIQKDRHLGLDFSQSEVEEIKCHKEISGKGIETTDAILNGFKKDYEQEMNLRGCASCLIFLAVICASLCAISLTVVTVFK